MKQIFLLLALIATYTASAQIPNLCGTKKGGFSALPLYKTTTTGHDSLYMHNQVASDTEVYAYSFTGDTAGIVTGTNSLGYYGFAERYNYSESDSSVTVLGVAAVFAGKVNPATSRIVDIKVWNSTGKIAGTRPNLFYGDMPATAVNSVSLPYTELGISDSSVVLKEFYFATPGTISSTFFVGYTTNYSWGALDGDTVAITTTKNGNRTSPSYTVVGADTIINVQNATLVPVDVWVDNGFDLGLRVNYWLFPIVNTTVFSHAGIKRNDFTFYGNYPNPAVTSTSVKFALAQPSGVKLQVIDAAGHTVKTVDEPALRAGDHIIQLATADMPAGNYLYVIRTLEGDGIVGKLSVTR